MCPLAIAGTVSAFSRLPPELFLQILDALIQTPTGASPVAFAPSSDVTRTLRSLTLTSRGIYPIASQYLYKHCLYLGTRASFPCLERTLAECPIVEVQPEPLEDDPTESNQELLVEPNIRQYISSVYVSATNSRPRSRSRPRNHFIGLIDFLSAVRLTLRRLVIDVLPTPDYAPVPEDSQSDVFKSMPNLEEVVASYDLYGWFRGPPPSVKRLAVSIDGFRGILLKWLPMMPMLEILVVVGEPTIQLTDINEVLKICPSSRKLALDIVQVDLSSNNTRVLPITRSLTNFDPLRFWDVDVPVSYYGDERPASLCMQWIFENAIRGTLFQYEKTATKTDIDTG